MTVSSTSHTLEVPGGSLHYEVRGSGPLLLVIGQPMTSEPFGPLADQLAVDSTVVTYDPHGLGRSTVEDPSLPVTPEVQADDLALLIEAVGSGRADVFGSSGGGVAALALATRHPDLVGTVIAHEPPVAVLLADAAHVRLVVDGVEEAFRSGGSGPGWAKFVALVMHDGPVGAEGVPPASWPPPGADASAGAQGEKPAAPSVKQQADDALFFLRMLKPFNRYQPDIDRLRALGSRLVVGVGETSADQVASRSAGALAEQLGVVPTGFPGDHVGFMGDPEAFAARIREVLANVSSGAAR